MDEVASYLMEHGYDKELVDVPTTLHGKPIGTYLRRRLRTRIGRPKNAPPEALKQMEEKLRPLREAAQAMAPKGHKQTQFKNLIIDVNEGRTIQIEARYRRFKRRSQL